MHRHKGLAEGLLGLVAMVGLITLAERLAGRSWDTIWRHWLAWIVICYAGILAFDLFAQLFLLVDQDVPHGLLLAGFIAIMAAWAVREHLRNPPRRP